MKIASVLSTAILTLSLVSIHAQTAATIAGNYVDQKSQSTYEIDQAGDGYTVKQIDTPVEKDKPSNGKVFAQITSVNGSMLTGTVTNGSKTYPTTWEIGADGSLTMKVKAGMFHYSTVWKHQ